MRDVSKELNTSALSYFERKLACETDPADVYQHGLAGKDDFVLVDVRSPAAFGESHVPRAINLPGGRDAERVLPKDKLIVVYCWGPGCNGAAKAAVRLLKEGFRVKEMIGGIEYWEDRERYPVERKRAAQC